MFKVVPDQLRISEGWVRCGQCGEIFNASQNLVAAEPARHAAEATEPPPSLAPPAAPEKPAQAPAHDAAPTHPLSAAPLDRAPADPTPVPAVDPVLATTPAEPQRGAFEQKVWDLEPVYADPAAEEQQAGIERGVDASTAATDTAPGTSHEPVWNDAPGTSAESPADTPHAALATTVAAAEALHTGTMAAPAAPPAANEGDPISFLQPDPQASFWSRRPVRLLLVAIAFLLAALLAAQVLVQERNRVVLLEPASRPVLQALCLLARCEIGPLRQIESIVIDSSSFGRLRADGYRLAFSLRNQAPIDIAMPAIELSLTDTQDQALVRRVIMPAEYGAPTPVLAAGTDWGSTLALNIRAGASTERIAGYRLLAFYP
jgi:predicted Zn finger-like uncharacterized protein